MFIKTFSTWLFKLTHKGELSLLYKLGGNPNVKQHNLINSVLIKLQLENKNVGKS